MKILKETTDEQLFYFCSSSTEHLTVEITNTVSDVVQTLTPTFYKEKFYNVFQAVFNLKQEQNYTIVIKDADGLTTYTNSIFCTNQVTDNYKISNNEYILP